MKSTNRSIAIISNSQRGGGAENSMMAIHREFISRGVDSTLIAINGEELAQELKSENIIELSRSWGAGPLGTFSNFQEFKKVLNQLAPELVVVNCELPELYISLIPRKNRKIICVEHTSKPWFGRKLLGRIVRKRLEMMKVNWVTVNSLEKVVWGTNSHPMYIPNPYIPKQSSVRLEPRQPCVTLIGRLRTEKRPEWAIEAAIKANLPIDLFGSGTLENGLIAKYRQNELVQFLGYRESAWMEISKESLIIVPSAFEGDGMVVIEAILNGNPILLADNQDLRRFDLGDKNYFKDENELVEKLSMAKSEGFQSFQIPENTRISLKSTRNLEVIVESWLNYLSN